MLVRVLCHEYSRSKRRCVTVRQPPILTSPKPISTLLQRFAIRPPSGDRWLHKIKRDGFRVIARKEGKRVKLYSRPGNDLTARFPLIVEALARLRSRSCIIDREAVACGDDEIASFDRIRHQHHDGSMFLFAFDLIELNGDDLRRDPLNVRKATLASVLARAAPGLRLNASTTAPQPPFVRFGTGAGSHHE
jgi:bifunctional non-homologous end joining protein LigD